jgi:hypothetical protein
MKSTHAFLVSCLVAAVIPLLPLEPAGPSLSTFPGWPDELEGQPLTPVPMSAREAQLARDFPGRVQTFTDGTRTIVLRYIEAQTRRLHPASDCFRGVGYEVHPLPVFRRGEETWGRFAASRAGESLVVRERIVAGDGAAWTDPSSWYWSAWLGRTRGPWWAMIVVERRT